MSRDVKHLLHLHCKISSMSPKFAVNLCSHCPQRYEKLYFFIFLNCQFSPQSINQVRTIFVNLFTSVLSNWQSTWRRVGSQKYYLKLNIKSNNAFSCEHLNWWYCLPTQLLLPSFSHKTENQISYWLKKWWEFTWEGFTILLNI